VTAGSRSWEAQLTPPWCQGASEQTGGRDVIVATFRPGTTLAGQTIDFEEPRFTVGSVLPITVDAILDLDANGELEWVFAGLREWVQGLQSQPAAATPPPPSPAQEAVEDEPTSVPENAPPVTPPPLSPVQAAVVTTPPPTSASATQRRIPVWGVVALTIVTFGLFLVGYLLYKMWHRKMYTRRARGVLTAAGIALYIGLLVAVGSLGGSTEPKKPVAVVPAAPTSATTTAATPTPSTTPPLTKATYMQKLVEQRSQL
jgi:hypothetical protein